MSTVGATTTAMNVGAAAFACLFAFGCASSTANVPTREMRMSATASDHHPLIDPANIQLDVSLNRGMSQLALSAGDSLTASLDSGPPVPLIDNRDELMPARWLDFHVDACRTLTVSLTRQNGENATSTVACMPRLAITEPAPGAKIPRTGVRIAWSNPVNGAKVLVQSFPCGRFAAKLTFDQGSPDTGAYEVPSSLFEDMGKPAAPGCRTLRVHRWLSAPPNAAFADGSYLTMTSMVDLNVELSP